MLTGPKRPGIPYLLRCCMVFTIEMLRTLKGAPLAVLIALALTRQPAGAEYLARVTGYSERPTEQALKLLADYGLATRNGRFAWQIAGGVVQLPFILSETNDDEPPQVGSVKSRNKCDSNSTATTAIVESQEVRSGAAVVNATESQKMRLNLKILKECGIFEPKASEIAALDWVTPDYIRRHAGYGERRGDPKGLVIHRMLAADPAPLSEEEQRSEYYRQLNRKYRLISDAEDNEEEEE